MNKIKKIINEILSILFPIECIGCNKENTYLCDDCFSKIPLHQGVKKFEHPLKYIDEIWTATDYKNSLIQVSIHYLKFRYIKELAKPLSKLLICFYESIQPDFDDPLIIPVPLNKKRLLERSFNQSELFGKYLCDYFNFEMMPDILKRTRNTPHQVGLNKKQRQTNLQNAFQIIKPDLIQNKNIILIDDVVTTGSTLDEIARALKQSGAKKVIGFTVAKD